MELGKEIDKKEFKRWIKALYAGTYKKGAGSLQEYTDGYCCLGVACKVLIPKKDLIIDDGVILGSMPDEQRNAPKWLKKINSDFSRKTEANLADLNDGNQIDDLTGDSLELTHPEIADLLQAVYVHRVLDKKRNKKHAKTIRVKK